MRGVLEALKSDNIIEGLCSHKLDVKQDKNRKVKSLKNNQIELF